MNLSVARLQSGRPSICRARPNGTEIRRLYSNCPRDSPASAVDHEPHSGGLATTSSVTAGCETAVVNLSRCSFKPSWHNPIPPNPSQLSHFFPPFSRPFTLVRSHAARFGVPREDFHTISFPLSFIWGTFFHPFDSLTGHRNETSSSRHRTPRFSSPSLRNNELQNNNCHSFLVPN